MSWFNLLIIPKIKIPCSFSSYDGMVRDNQNTICSYYNLGQKTDWTMGKINIHRRQLYNTSSFASEFWPDFLGNLDDNEEHKPV